MDKAAEFTVHRPRMLAAAYHVLGSRADAEDVVQDAWHRFDEVDPATVRDAGALLTVIVSRLALNAARDRARRRETYVGPWLPEPITDATPEWAVLQRDGLGQALDVVLASLTPEQATAFVLREVLDVDYAQIAEILECAEPTARQHVSRGRRRAREAFGSPREALNARGAHALEALGAAVLGGDVEAVAALLSPDSVLFADGGGLVRSAVRPITGRDAVARFLLGIASKGSADMQVLPAMINGGPGVVVVELGAVTTTLAVRTEGDAIAEVYIVRNPEKLAAVAV